MEVFHAGERAVQARVGVRARMAEIGPRVIRDAMPQQHRDFFPLLDTVFIGSLQRNGQQHSGGAWASLLTGDPGFVTAPDARLLRVAARPAADDPLAETLRDGVPLGLLGLQFETRRRNRVNGIVRDCGPDGFSVEVRQSFGNCPKYIFARTRVPAPADPGSLPQPGVSRVLTTPMLELIARADTLFIASAAPCDGADGTGGVDVSHRGGLPGFLRLEGGATLLLPDFPGNLFFNTLGNLTEDPRAGVLVPDFATGAMLHLAVRTEILWEPGDAYPGAERLVRLRVGEARWSRAHAAWTSGGASPYAAALGPWTVPTLPARQTSPG